MSGLVHTCGQNPELVSIDKVLRLFIDKLQVRTLDKKFQIMLDFFRNSLQTKSAICLQTIADFVYKVCTKPYITLKIKYLSLFLWRNISKVIGTFPRRIQNFHVQIILMRRDCQKVRRHIVLTTFVRLYRNKLDF